MNKKELIRRLSEENGITKTAATQLLNATLSVIQKTLKKGIDVKISGFGRWFVLERKSRSSRNPRTGEIIYIPASRVPSFKCGKRLKHAFK